MDDLLRRMAQDNFRFEVNAFPSGTLSDWDESAFVALTPIFEDRIELQIFGGFRWPDYYDNEQFCFHIRCHRKSNFQSVLRMRRCIECNQYPLKSDKNWASHGNNLSLSFSGGPQRCLCGSLAC